MFKMKQVVAAAVIAAASSMSMAGGGSLGTLTAIDNSASFSGKVTGPFTDTWTFELGGDFAASTSVTNTRVRLSGGIIGFGATLDGAALSLDSSGNRQELYLLSIT